jgi:streptogramin lyase
MRLAAPFLLAVSVGLGACGSSGGSAAEPRSAARVTEAAAPVPAGDLPVDVAVSADAVWVLDQAQGRLTRHDARTARRTGRGVRVGSSPVAVAVGEGAAWVLDARDGVQRVDASTGRPTGPPVPVTDPVAIAVGAGTVWVTSRASRAVIPIDAAAMQPGTPIKLKAAPGDIVFAEDAVWVAQTDAGTVTRIDARSRTASPPLRLASGQLLALAAGDGAVHAAVARTRLNDALELVSIDAGTGKVDGERTPITGGIPLRLAASGGSVWVTDVGSTLPGSAGRRPRLLRVDPGKGPADAVATISGRPSSVATGTGAVWVTDSTRGTLTRFTLR